MQTFSLWLFAAAAGVVLAKCDYGPDTCVQGYVWREAFTNDHVCVTPAVRSQAASDNSLASTRRSSTGGAFGPDTCLQGYVWREASPTDRVCVTPATRAQAAADNAAATTRVECDCPSGGYTSCTQEWFGTAPFCNGQCPEGWDFVRSGSGGCDASREGYCVDCVGSSGNSCWSGHKVLCETCYGVVRQS